MFQKIKNFVSQYNWGFWVIALFATIWVVYTVVALIAG